MFKIRSFSFFIALTTLPHVALADDTSGCRVLQDSMRIDTPQAVAAMQDVCEVKGGIGIFTRGISEITFPRLKKINLINIEAEGLKAINFPQLETVSYLYISGGQLVVAEFPNLRSVTNTMYVKSRRLLGLNFPHLGRVWKLNIQGNMDLQYIFADQLYDVYQLHLENNPRLDPGTVALLQGNTRVLTQEEQQYIADAEQRMRDLKERLLDRAFNQPEIPPTGHPTYFDTYTTYYYNYPRFYSSYWDRIRFYGYDQWYRAPYFTWPWLY